MHAHEKVRAIKWEDNQLWLLDQRELPSQKRYIRIDRCRDATHAIRDMVVRGAPAIGITAAYAVVLAAREHIAKNPQHWRESIEADLDSLRSARPTAVNLRWAVHRMQAIISSIPDTGAVARLLAQAMAIHDEDVAANHEMGRLGANLMKDNTKVLTHCNAGALATGGYGTALGVIRTGFKSGKIDRVFVGETRPWLQGARLTAWELLEDDIPLTLIPDAAAAHVMANKLLDWVIVGADRVASNGDVANKIGTYSLAVLARNHGVKFMVVASVSTIDLGAATGRDIEIEHRQEQEVLVCGGQAIAPAGSRAFNPVFDITPAELVDYFVTEKGIVVNPNPAGVQALLVNKQI